MTDEIILKYAIVWAPRLVLWGGCMELGGKALQCGLCSLLGAATGMATKASIAIGGLVPAIAGAGAAVGCFAYSAFWDYISP